MEYDRGSRTTSIYGLRRRPVTVGVGSKILCILMVILKVAAVRRHHSKIESYFAKRNGILGNPTM